MTSMITIDTEYYMTATAIVNLSPKTWDDVEDWYIRWDKLEVKFKDADDWESFVLYSDTDDGVDWSRPNRADIYDADDLGNPISTREDF